MEPEAHSDEAAVNSLMNILPDDSMNHGNTGSDPQPDPQLAADVTPKAETKPEIKPDASTGEPKPKYKVKVQGDEMEVDLDELLNGYSRQADYTKKTTELSAKQKEFESRLGELRQVDEFKQKLTHYEQLLGEQVLADQNRDWNKLLEENPIEYLKQKQLAEARANEWNVTQTKRREENEVQHRQTLAREGEQLLAKRPEWKDEAVWNADREKISGFLQNQGYRQEEINAVTDHRILLVVDKARRYDELMAAKAETEKKIEKLPPKVERPGVPSGSDGQSNKEAMGRLRKSGSIDDAAAAIMSHMN